MTQQEKRIKIAQACGWKMLDGKEYKWEDPSGHIFEDWSKRVVMCPDYFNNLNACHDMEKVVLENAGSWVRYVKEIKVQSCLTGLPHFHIPAAERAEAFGKTLNLW